VIQEHANVVNAKNICPKGVDDNAV
jgi:hypothetical protein